MAYTHGLLFLEQFNHTQTVPIQNHTTTVSRPFFRDHPGELALEENFWTLWCKGRLTEADTLTMRLGATPFGLPVPTSTIQKQFVVKIVRIIFKFLR